MLKLDIKELLPFLELFKELTLMFSKTTKVTMPRAGLEFERLFVLIQVNFLDKSLSQNLRYAVEAAKAKLTKYYTRMESPVYTMATVLDPRFKLGVYKKTQDCDALTEAATTAVTNLFHEYKNKFALTPIREPVIKRKRDWYEDDEYEEPKTELVLYLEESRVPTGQSDKKETVCLQYWQANKTRFPILARMARDYLSVQPTGKDIEGTFSKGRRTIPYYRKRQTGSTTRSQMLVNAGYDLGMYE
jgi:hypothetical protein